MNGRNRFFHPAVAGTVWVVLLGVGLGGMIWWGQGAWREARMYRRQVDLKYRELESMTKSVPAPTETMAKAIVAELAQAEQVRRGLQVKLQGDAASADRLRTTPAPASGTEFFFDLVAFCERIRERARSRDVILEQDEYFGFSEYAHGGPAGELLLPLFRQRLIVEQLLGALLEAQPRKLILVQREVTAPSVMTGGARDDEMIMPRSRSLRMEGLVATMGFRIGFTGYTSTLRTFLSEMDSLGLPVAVRLIEAEPILIEGELIKNAPKPFVERAPTKFTVTLEYLELVPPPPSGA